MFKICWIPSITFKSFHSLFHLLQIPPLPSNSRRKFGNIASTTRSFKIIFFCSRNFLRCHTAFIKTPIAFCFNIRHELFSDPLVQRFFKNFATDAYNIRFQSGFFTQIVPLSITFYKRKSSS